MNKMNVTIRPAKNDDYESVNSLYLKSYSEDFQAMPDTYKKMPATIISRNEFVDIVNDNNWDILVAEEGGIIIGMVCLSIETDKGDRFSRPYKRVSIDEFYFDKKYSGRDLGSMLIACSEKWAKKKHISNVTVMIYSHDKKDCELLEGVGYKPFSIRMNKIIKP